MLEQSVLQPARGRGHGGAGVHSADLQAGGYFLKDMFCGEPTLQQGTALRREWQREAVTGWLEPHPSSPTLRGGERS